MSTYGRNLIKIRIWQNLDKCQVFTPQPRFAARIPLVVWETQTYPQIAVACTVRHGSEVEVITQFGPRISENTKIGPWYPALNRGYLQGKFLESTVPACQVASCTRTTRYTHLRTHNLSWFLRYCSMSVKIRIFWRPHGCVYKSTRFVMPGEPIRPNISPRPT